MIQFIYAWAKLLALRGYSILLTAAIWCVELAPDRILGKQFRHLLVHDDAINDSIRAADAAVYIGNYDLRWAFWRALGCSLCSACGVAAAIYIANPYPLLLIFCWLFYSIGGGQRAFMRWRIMLCVFSGYIGGALAAFHGNLYPLIISAAVVILICGIVTLLEWED